MEADLLARPQTVSSMHSRALLLLAGLLLQLPRLAAGAQDTAGIPAVQPRLRALVPPAPTPASFISDAPDVIPAADQALIDDRIGALQAEGLGDIAVAILPSIESYQPYEVGVAIYRTWRVGRIDSIGSARRNLGVLLLIVPKELAPDNRGHCWITTGLGAERLLTDASAGRICREKVSPRLVTREYAAAVTAGVDALGELLRADAELAAEPVSERRFLPRVPGAYGAPLVLALALSLVALAFGIRLWLRERPRKCPVCRARMFRVHEEDDDASLDRGQRLEEKLGSVDYDVWQCECGEQMIVPHRALFTRFRDCPACKVRAVKTKRVTVTHATYASPGLAVETSTCESCGDTRKREIVLPVLQKPSDGGSSTGGSRAALGGGGGGGRSSGGGRSFGGSGRTAGGGGGGRY